VRGRRVLLLARALLHRESVRSFPLPAGIERLTHLLLTVFVLCRLSYGRPLSVSAPSPLPIRFPHDQADIVAVDLSVLPQGKVTTAAVRAFNILSVVYSFCCCAIDISLAAFVAWEANKAKVRSRSA
jgi:hypothetical protein